MNELGKLGRPTRGWSRARCPFHHPDKHPSLVVNLASGGFYCFSCGEKGGDIVDFVMKRDGIGFIVAARRLGAWVDHKETGVEREELAQQEQWKRKRIRDAAIKLAAAEKSLRLNYRDAVHRMEKIISEMGERLLLHGSMTNDHASCGQLLSQTLDDLRRSIAAHALLCFGPISDCANFMLHFDQLDAAVTRVMLRGSVVDDDGFVTEVVFP